eukprot:16390-Eustigmatos_ZCMA.PRE.1
MTRRGGGICRHRTSTTQAPASARRTARRCRRARRWSLCWIQTEARSASETPIAVCHLVWPSRTSGPMRLLRAQMH